MNLLQIASPERTQDTHMTVIISTDQGKKQTASKGNSPEKSCQRTN